MAEKGKVVAMELYKEMIAGILVKQMVDKVLPELVLHEKDLVELVSYQTLVRIKGVLEDESLNDRECFEKIEEIIALFEGIGSGGGGRHDL